MKYNVGETFNWFIGIVEDVNDPLKVGRMKVRVINEHNNEEVSTEELPWAYPMNPIQSASLASQNAEDAKVNPGPTAIGFSPTGIEKGSYVFGFYLDSAEKNVPIVIGSYPKIPGATSDNIENAGDIINHDVSKLARGEQTLRKNKTNGNLVKEPSSAYGAVYPFNKTFTTRSGHAIEIDDTKGKERIHVYHKSGTYTEINNEGRSVKKVVGDDYEIVVKGKNVYVKGNLVLEVDGNATVNIAKNANITVGENVNLNVGGNMTADIDQDFIITCQNWNLTADRR